AQRARLGGDAAAVHAGDDVHARLVADGLERLADRPLQRGAREEHVELAAVDRVRAGARDQDDAGDRGLALARRAVARAGGQVDRDRGDRLVGDLLGVAGRRLLGVLALAAQQRVGALLDDVDLDVDAGDLGLDARGLVDVVLLEVLVAVGRRGRVGGGGDRVALRRGLVGRRLLGGWRVLGGGRGLLGRRGFLGRRGLLGGGLGSGCLGGGGLLLGGGRCLLRLFLGRGAVVGHQDVSSIGVGFWAACGCSGPA